jgi:predicted ATPase
VVAETGVIRTPDQRVRVFVSSALQELAPERLAVRDAVARLRLVPVMFELGARPHPARQLYRDYLAQSQIFIGLYWQSYGWVAAGEDTSGLEDEYLLSAGMPRLIYIKSPAPQREPRLTEMLARIRDDADFSYQLFSDTAELGGMVENDLAVLLSERFETARSGSMAAAPGAMAGDDAAPARALPVPPTPLIGREQDAAAVEDLVVKEGVRLITLTGPGGIGKSRLAVEAAQRLMPRFRDGVRFVELSAVQADGVADAIATALRMNTSGANLSNDVTSYLRTRQVLLVLDNFEQAMGAAPLVANLLSGAPDLVALVTSRSVLRLSAEHEFPVRALALPDAGSPDVDVAGRYSAVRLFAERAHSVAPGFRLTGANVEAVTEICRRLDGLPLAIELAAARVKLLPPRELLARLGDSLGLLTGGARDLPVRQRTLRSTLDWSFGLLSSDEQALFTRLGVFAGPFDLSAVQAVVAPAAPVAADAASPDQSWQVMETLESLVDSSMVQPQAGFGDQRFGLLDTLRQYALERMRDIDGGWPEAHDRHAAYYVGLAHPAAAELQGPGQLAWLRRLEAEHANLAAAMSWLIDQDQLETAVSLGWATWKFWWLQGHADEMVRFGRAVLAKSGPLPTHWRALALAFSAFENMIGEDRPGARAIFEQALPLFRESGDKLRTALTAGVLGHLLALDHDEAGASELLKESQTLLRDLGTHEFSGSDRVQQALNVALLCNFLGQIRLSQGDDQGAAELFAQALSTARQSPDRYTFLISLYDLAVSSHARGDLSAAAAHLTEGLSMAAEAGDKTSTAYYLEALAVMATPEDHPERAVHLLAAANALWEANGSGWLHAFLPRGDQGEAARSVLRSRLGETEFEAAWAYGRSMGGQRSVEYALTGDQTSTPDGDPSTSASA